ncbi:MAG TPA: TonB-dependent receptor [Longimicrobium sp.]|uniref:TonB-dependent receptor n=1 Tax=Longimicrobium sp. TaxID=2029185 RepID=UPI002ED788FC
MRAPRAARSCAYACVLAVLACAAGTPAYADAPCRAEPQSAASSSSRGWAPPLNRAVEFRARDLSLRDALDQLSATTGIRISYSAQLLPLDQRVCVSSLSRTLGDALAELLQGTPLEPVVAGADHVVLALRRSSPADADEAEEEFSRVVPLDRIVVTGSAGGAPQRALPFALDVVGAQQMERQGTVPLTRLLNAGAAGPWGWEQPPSSLMARYGSIRGASSFGVSAPKVFIDGIEVANPLLVTQIAPEAVERIEVIRGPQGAALYGIDAISGVVNIITKHEGTDTGASRLRVRGSVGTAASEFATGRALSQEHAVALRTGTSLRSAGVDVGLGTVGDYLPGGEGGYVLASAGARQVGARSIVTGIARFYAARAGSVRNPLLTAAIGPRGDSLQALAASERQGLRQYTVGGTVRLVPEGRWTHSFTAGIDGDRLSGVVDERTPVPGAAQDPLRGAAGGADRGTLRVSSVGRWDAGARTALTLTLATEHSVLREEVAPPEAPAAPGEPAPPRGFPTVSWTQRSGVVAQGAAALDDRLHLTGGLRVERNEGFAGTGRHALPVVGAAYVTGVGGASLKLRAAYGSGIRPTRTPGRDHAWVGSRQWRGPELSPERQSGVEGGFDLAYGGATLQATVYDQLASGLIQRVALPWDTAGGMPRRTSYALQNVGQISNRGWEMQGAARLGRLSLEAAAAGVDSRVRRLAPGYGGDLRAGDRMLEVPALTLSGTAAWTERRWSASVTAHRAADWINYDRLALARDFASGTDAGGLAGAHLRGYWRAYAGVTRLNANATLALPRGTTLVLTGYNLLDRQQGEPDNVTVVPGRTLMLGLRAAF